MFIVAVDLLDYTELLKPKNKTMCQTDLSILLDPLRFCCTYNTIELLQLSKPYIKPWVFIKRTFEEITRITSSCTCRACPCI